MSQSKRKNAVITLFVLLCLSFPVIKIHAGNTIQARISPPKKITGTVIDNNEEPVIGATVIVKGTSIGTTTDMDGKFILDIESNEKTLVVSYVGYTPLEITVQNDSHYTITLKKTDYALEEVVVTALGIKRDKKALGYAVQDVKGEALTTNQSPNIASSLNGRIAGMNISATSIPGGSNRIVIRGNNSILGNNMPLIVVDGIPFDNTQGVADVNTTSWGVGFTDTGDGLSTLNPNDVESISVLKGPSATALYGSRGGNGVILITTKKGTDGKVKVTFNSNFMLENIMIQPEFQNEFGQGSNGEFNTTSRNSWGPKIGTVVTDWTGQTRPLEAKNNNFDDFMNMGTVWTNSLDVTGMAAKMTYRFGLSNTTHTGVIPNNKLLKNSISMRIGGEILKNLTLDAKLNYTRQKGEGRPEFSASGFNPIFSLIYTPRSINLHEMKDVSDENGKIIDWYSGLLTMVNNPYAITSLTGNQDVTNRINGFVSLSHNITNWLKAMVRMGGDTYGKENEKWVRHNLISSSGYVDGVFATAQHHVTEYNSDFLVTAQKEGLIAHQLSGMVSVGGNLMNRKFNSTSAYAEGLNIPEQYTIHNGKSITNATYKSEKEVRSLYAMAQISWNNYLYLDVTVRNDWSSTLPKQNRSFMYPSVSLSWVVTDMLNTMNIQKPRWLSYGKLRASYAEAGSDTNPYQLYPTLTTVPNMAEGQAGVAMPSIKENANLKPESVKSMEFGIDLRLFDNRFGIDLTYYNKQAYNQIISMPTSITSGHEAEYVNAGQVKNKGWELQLNTVPIRTKNWEWNVWGNFATNNSRIVELTNGVKSINLARPMGQNCFVMAKVGEPYGQIYTNGFMYDDNGNRLVGDDGKFIVNQELRVSGNMNPDWTAGVGSSLNWKRISLGVLLDIRYGGDIYLQSMMRLQSCGQTKETAVGREQYYTSGKGLISEGIHINTGLPNTIELDPTAYWGQFYGNIENYIYDTTNIRLRELSLSWTMPIQWFHKTAISDLKISAVANNLCFLYNNLPGFDPECTYSTGNGQGIEMASLPSTRSFGFNVMLSF